MIKSLKAIIARDKGRYKVPRSVKDLIPISSIWNDGVFRCGNVYTKSYRFSDINYMVASREAMINPLEPKTWDEGGTGDEDAPQAFRQRTKLSQHISFLKDFFRCYKDFDDRHIDTIEIMLGKLYEQFGISDSTDFGKLTATDYPILSDLYGLIEDEYKRYDKSSYQLYTADLLQEILLGLHSMCMGAESKFFNGHTNVTSDRLIVFGVKGLLQASKNVKNALLFNVLSFMSDKLLTEGTAGPSFS